MKSQENLRKGRLLAAVLAGSWRQHTMPTELTELELDEIAPLLCKSGTAPLAWQRVGASQLAGRVAGEVLHQATRLQALQAAMQDQQVEKIFRLLTEASVDPILAKGWAATRLYHNHDLRPRGDIDLCVRPAQVALTKKILESEETRDCYVDLHHQYSELTDRPLEELFDRSQVLPLGKQYIRVLGPEDHLSLLCIHLLKHAAWRPLWLCDIASTLESIPAQFHWQVVFGNGERRARWVGIAFGLSHRLLGAKVDHVPLPTEFFRVPDWLVDTVLYHWSRLIPGDQLPMRPPILMVQALRERRNILKAIRERWPDPITATFNLRGEFNNSPRWPYQLADFLRVTTQFMFELPRKLKPRSEEAS